MNLDLEIVERIARIETHVQAILQYMRDHKSHESRLSSLETERKIWGKIVHPLLALVSGFFGGWVGRNHG